MEFADLLVIIILGWPVIILIINTIVLVITKESGQDANGQKRRSQSIFASKKIIGYAAAFFLPINFALTFLVLILHLILYENPPTPDYFFAPAIPESLWISVCLFIGLYLLGLILGVIGVVIIFFEEKDRRYSMIASVGLLSHVLYPAMLVFAWFVID